MFCAVGLRNSQIKRCKKAMNIADLPEDSDTSDEDYTPSGNQEDAPSEVESDGDSEEHLSDTASNATGKKRKKKTNRIKKKIKVASQESGSARKENDSQQEESEKDKKKKIDDLWADFMKDTGFKSRNDNNKEVDLNTTAKEKEKNASVEKNEDRNVLLPSQKPQKCLEKVKVTQIFEFAGEEVRVEKEVRADSAEARLLNKTSNNEAATPSKAKRSGGLGGISNVLSQLGKKPKITTLEKSKLDWDNFKKEEKIEEELQIYNKGKDGYLDRQDFLQRADQRRFEIEKDLRTVERNKRFNSTL